VLVTVMKVTNFETEFVYDALESGASLFREKERNKVNEIRGKESKQNGHLQNVLRSS